ncbi:MAG: FecR domain-containing protein [Pseudomonadota bacterium]
MPSDDQDQVRLVEEATDLFLRLRHQPDDQELRREKAAFLARGEVERRVWETVLKAWKGTGVERKSKTPPILGILALIAAASYFGAEPLRLALLADHQAGLTPLEVSLSSGDVAALDAGSALIEEISLSIRHVELMKGTALFDVESGEAPFSVSLGPLDVEVVGTVFETARLGETLAVSVKEGQVSVSTDGEEWLLSAGDRVRWREDTGGELDKIDPSMIGLWQQDQFVVDGMTFGEVASIIDRRLRGSIVIVSEELARSEIAGVIDLSDPVLAIKTLSAARSAVMIEAVPFVTILYLD